MRWNLSPNNFRHWMADMAVGSSKQRGVGALAFYFESPEVSNYPNLTRQRSVVLGFCWELALALHALLKKTAQIKNCQLTGHSPSPSLPPRSAVECPARAPRAPARLQRSSVAPLTLTSRRIRGPLVALALELEKDGVFMMPFWLQALVSQPLHASLDLICGKTFRRPAWHRKGHEELTLRGLG